MNMGYIWVDHAIAVEEHSGSHSLNPFIKVRA
ncbi:protein of unknown function [Kyrpidia spormannii]|uniref:Uncharacterized protein n=1 Tax=Kyrpidia spormannii TaxID=2055160 RepID=A0ACA8Z771_9BACL|nr:protein of unknown function [Kyrpidia spormannii]